MKKFSDYSEFVEKRKKEIEEENKKWEVEEDRQSYFFKKNVVPALENMTVDNEEFNFEFKEVKNDHISISHSYDLLINDEYGMPHGRYHLNVKLNSDEKFDNLEFKITNYHSDKEVESFKDYNEMTPDLIEHNITDLLMALYEKDQN